MTATERAPLPVYWDASAVLSLVVRDVHSSRARTVLRRPGIHLLSTLAWAETLGGLARLEANREVAAPRARQARKALLAVTWTRLELQPDRDLLVELAGRQRLRGADLWHLALALTLRGPLPELAFLSFDERLAAAAVAEGLAPPA